MIPIEKNILVVDEFGSEYEATWPKRARGLVKNGRARFVSENKICLACPPEIDLEDNEMTDNNESTIHIGITGTENGENSGQSGRESTLQIPGPDTEAIEAMAAGQPDVKKETPIGRMPELSRLIPGVNADAFAETITGQAAGHQPDAEKAEPIDLAYIFRQIKEIQEQTAHLNLVVDALSRMGDGESGAQYAPGNIQGQAKANALGDVARYRETTNQRLLEFYVSVYKDMTAQPEVVKFLH